MNESSRKTRAQWAVRGVLVLASVLMTVVPLRQLVGQQEQRVGFIFLPFEDRSSFHGKWNVSQDIPRFLSAYVKERLRTQTVSPILVLDYLQTTKKTTGDLDDVRFWLELHQRFGLRYLVTGRVEAFDVSRFSTGEPMLGGYEAYKGEVSITYSVYDLERTRSSPVPVQVAQGEAAGAHTDRSLALTLFGKQTQRTLEFRELDKIRFGSDEFNHTVIGEACFRLAKQFATQLSSALPSLRSPGGVAVGGDSLFHADDSLAIALKRRVITGTIVFVEGERAFLNLGTEDGLELYQRIKVYEKGEELRDPVTRRVLGFSGDEIGEVEVIELRGSHLSLATIVIGKDRIQSNDRVLVYVVE